jgi:hypothetical protein
VSDNCRAYVPPKRSYRKHLGNRVIVAEGEGSYEITFADMAMRDRWFDDMIRRPDAPRSRGLQFN